MKSKNKRETRLKKARKEKKRRERALKRYKKRSWTAENLRRKRIVLDLKIRKKADVNKRIGDISLIQTEKKRI